MDVGKYIKKNVISITDWRHTVEDAQLTRGHVKIKVNEANGEAHLFSVSDFNPYTLVEMLKAYNKENPTNKVKYQYGKKYGNKITKDYLVSTVERLILGDKFSNRRAENSYNAMADSIGLKRRYSDLSNDEKADADYLFKYAIKKGYLDPNKTNYVSDDVVRAIWEVSSKETDKYRTVANLRKRFEERISELERDRKEGVKSAVPEEDESKFTKNRKKEDEEIIDVGYNFADEFAKESERQENASNNKKKVVKKTKKKKRKRSYTVDDSDSIAGVDVFSRG